VLLHSNDMLTDVTSEPVETDVDVLSKR